MPRTPDDPLNPYVRRLQELRCLREVFDLHAAGKTRVIRETRPPDQVNQAIADVEAGRVAARIVLEPST